MFGEKDPSVFDEAGFRDCNKLISHEMRITDNAQALKGFSNGS